MILSHRHGFVFIKNRKVASTSMEVALAPICGPEDVLTPDHIHRSERDVLAVTARNYEGSFNPVRELAHARRPVEAARIVRDRLKRPAFYNHMRASSVRARVDRDVWNGYYKFCFERNPWDKAVSFYHWFWRGREAPVSVDEFIRRHREYGTLDQALPTDWSRYTSGGKVIVDDVYDYADIPSALPRALSRAGVPDDVAAAVTLGREKSTLRPRRETVLSPESDRVIRRVFAREIAAFPFCRTPPETVRIAPGNARGGAPVPPA